MNKKDHPRKPVIRNPLPEKDWITLCELVTWRATGKAWPARRLKGLMKRNRGQRRPIFLWDSFEREAANVVSLCCKSDLSPYGSVDGGPHQRFSRGYFLNDVYAEPVLDSIGPDPLADQNGSYPEGLPTYCFVRFLRSDALSIFGQADQPAAETDQAPAWGTQDGADPDQAVVSTPPVFIKKRGARSAAEPPGTTAGGVDSTVERRAKRTFSKAKVRRWYTKRVKEWPPDQRPPSRDGDIREAKDKFGEAVTHKFIRDLRAEIAPTEWTAKRRPKAR